MIVIPIPFTKYAITYGEENDTRPKMVFGLPTGPSIATDECITNEEPIYNGE